MNKLEASVFATNKAHEEGIKLYNLLAPIFRPLVGTKILKADGSFTQKVEKLIPKLPYQYPLHITINSRQYDISYTVRYFANYSRERYDRWEDKDVVEEASLSRDTTIYIGKLDGAVLTEIWDSPNRRTDYTVEEVLANRAAFKAAEEVYNAAKSALGLFGEYDRD